MKAINEKAFYELCDDETIEVQGGNTTFFKVIDFLIRCTFVIV